MRFHRWTRGIFLLLVGSVIVGGQNCGTIYNNSGCGGKGAIVFNVTSQSECCEKCAAYSCVTYTYGQTETRVSWQEQFPTHNCAVMSYYREPRSVEGHICGVPSSPAPSPDTGVACNADISCLSHGGANWRCGVDPNAKGSNANCHKPGPGTQGNQTCSCQTQHCQQTHVQPQTGKIQYLMIGDSISLGMKPYVFQNLSMKNFQSTHSPGNSASSNLGAHCMSSWVDAPDVRWDIISFNFEEF